MTIFKINKTFTNGNKILYQIFTDDVDAQDEEYVRALIEETCDKDPSGHNNGYSCSYEKLEDETEIQEVLKKEFKQTTSRIDDLIEYRNHLLDNIKK